MISVMQSLLSGQCSVRTICVEVAWGHWFSPSSMWGLGLDSSPQLWQQSPWPMEPPGRGRTFTHWAISVASKIVLWCYHPTWQPGFTLLPRSPINLGIKGFTPVQVASLSSVGSCQVCLFHFSLDRLAWLGICLTSRHFEYLSTSAPEAFINNCPLKS